MFRDGRFWFLYFFMFLFVICLRYQTTREIQLPEAAHNTVGDLPLLEQADDGFVSSIGEQNATPHQTIFSGPKSGDFITFIPSRSLVSRDTIHFSTSNLD